MPILFHSPAKASEKTPSKTSPKKRNSGHDHSGGVYSFSNETICNIFYLEESHLTKSFQSIPDTEKVLINKTELDNVVYKNAKSLRTIGLEAILDLHAQMYHIVQSYSTKYDRTKLPQELQATVTRYLQYAKK